MPCAQLPSLTVLFAATNEEVGEEKVGIISAAKDVNETSIR